MDRAHSQLEENTALLDRLEGIASVRYGKLPPISNPDSVEERVKRMYDNVMWSINNQYVVRTPDGDSLTVWYVPDEVGTAVSHSPDPNCRLVPFIDGRTGQAYSLLWPIERLDNGDLATRDFVPSGSKPRSPRLLPYGPSVISSEDEEDEEDEEEVVKKSDENDKTPVVTIEEKDVPSLPKMLAERPFFPTRSISQPVRVWADSKLVCSHLTRPDFRLVDKSSEADVLWCGSDEFRAYDALAPHQFINQLPGERCVCFKNELARTVQTAFGGPKAVPWLPETYDLEAELPLFVKRFKERQDAGQDNHWIVKPWNAARSLDIVITNRIETAVKLAEGGNPRIACKYVEKPTTYEGRKYDLRFLVYARSEKGDEIPQFSLYNTFWIRFANRQYKLDDLWDYETHFTVMNYREQSHMTHIRDTEFVPWFNKTHGDGSWNKTLEKIKHCLAELFFAAVKCRGLGKVNGETANAYAVYGIDLLLTEDLEPMIEEINFGPDCHRACDYDPEFYNKTFGHFFFGELENVSRFL